MDKPKKVRKKSRKPLPKAESLTLIDQPECGRLIYAQREDSGLSLRDAAAQMGIAFNALTRIEHGHNVRYDTMIKALRWCVHRST